jgi:hypothetical protein
MLGRAAVRPALGRERELLLAEIDITEEPDQRPEYTGSPHRRRPLAQAALRTKRRISTIHSGPIAPLSPRDTGRPPERFELNPGSVSPETCHYGTPRLRRVAQWRNEVVPPEAPVPEASRSR